MVDIVGQTAGTSQTTAADTPPETLQQDAQADTGPGDRNPDTGILCLAMMLQFHKMAADPSQLAHEFAPENGTTNLLGLVRAAKQIGLKARSGELKIKQLYKAPLRAIAEAQDGTFFILARANDEKALIRLPGKPPETITHEELKERWTGNALLTTTRAAIAGELLQGERLGQEFDFLAMPMMFVEDTLIRINPKLGSILAPFSAVVRTLDRFVLKWRPLRRYAFRVVVILKWPRAHETG